VRLLAPPFCRPEVEVNGLRIAFSGGTRAEMRRTEDDRPWLVLEAGRCIVMGAIGPAEVRITAGGLDGIVTGVPGAPLGVEVERGMAADADPSADPGGPSGVVTRLHATQAAVPWRQIAPAPDGAGATAVPAASTLAWNALDPASVQVARRDRSPAWLAAPAADDAFEQAAREAEMPVLVCSSHARMHVRSIVERFRPSTSVMAQGEIHPRARLKTVGSL
jgi:flagellar biosynthesis protein FlhA